MKQKIDCFLACHQAGEVSHTVRQLEGSTAVSRVILLEGQPLQSSAMMMLVAEKAVAPYVLMVMKPVPLTMAKEPWNACCWQPAILVQRWSMPIAMRWRTDSVRRTL